MAAKRRSKPEPKTKKRSAIGERIEAAMHARGIKTQGELERLLGTARGTLNRYMTGTRGALTVKVETFQKLAKVLRVNFEWLLTGDGPMWTEGGDPPPSPTLGVAESTSVRNQARSSY